MYWRWNTAEHKITLDLFFTVQSLYPTTGYQSHAEREFNNKVMIFLENQSKFGIELEFKENSQNYYEDIPIIYKKKS